MVPIGGEGADICVTPVGARGVAVATYRSAQPYEFAYDHVSGDLGTQDDLFMCRPLHHVVAMWIPGGPRHEQYVPHCKSVLYCATVLCCAVLCCTFVRRAGSNFIDHLVVPFALLFLNISYTSYSWRSGWAFKCQVCLSSV